MQSCNTPCTGTEYPIHMGTVPLKEEEEEEEEEYVYKKRGCQMKVICPCCNWKITT